MAQFKFEGDLDILTEVQVKLVESVLQKQGFKDGKVLVEPVGKKGDNYVAQVKRFIYEVDNGSTFKMIGKIAPVAEELRVMMKTTLLFNNEIVMYDSVIPKFNNIQNSAGITEDEKEGKAVEDVMIDYQVARNASPAADLLYLMFNCTDHATRLQQYNDWIDYYHKSLDDALNNHGLKANRISPKDQLDADLKRYGRLMVNVSLLLSSILIRESKDVVDFSNVENFTGDNIVNITSAVLDTYTINRLKERIKGIIDSAHEFGLIKIK